MGRAANCTHSEAAAQHGLQPTAHTDLRVHGVADEMVPVEQSRRLCHLLPQRLPQGSCFVDDDDAIVVIGETMAEGPRLLDRVRAEIRARHYSRRTEEAYAQWIRRYILFHGKRHPNEMGAGHITSFLTALAVDRGVAAATQNQAFSALVFLYRQVLRQDVGLVEHVPRAKTPVRVPVVLTREEVRCVLSQMQGVPRLVSSILYGAGLRLQEGLELRVKDLDFERREIMVRRGKGQKRQASHAAGCAA